MIEQIMNDLSEQAKKIMAKEGIAYSSDLSADKILLEYMNAKIKLIPNQKRKVEFSNELRQKISDDKFERDGMLIDKNEAVKVTALIKRFQHMFEEGENVNYHLSRLAFNSKIFDTLLNAWNIKHIHLSDKISLSKSSMKKNRSEWLLFCIVEDNSVYFLDVLNHPTNEHFTAYNFLQIAHKNNWMEHIGFHEMTAKDIVPDSLEPKITKDEDIYKLYKLQLNISFEFEGKIYTSFGIASSGDKTISSLNLINLKKRLKKILAQDKEYLSIQFDSDDSLNGTIHFRNGICPFPFEAMLS